MLLRRASLPIWEGFGGFPGGFGGLQLQHLGCFFSFLARLGAPPLPQPFLEPVLASFWTFFLGVPRRVLVFQLALMRCATELVVAHRRERWVLVFSAWEMLSFKRKLVSIAFFNPWTCTVGSPLVSTCPLSLLRVQYPKRILC